MRRSPILAACAACLAALAIAPAARADVFGSSELVSQGLLPDAGGGMAQASYAHDPASSLDGRYVVFDGSFGGLAGVWRRDLQTGEVRPVAIGRPLSPGARACESVASPERGRPMPSPCDALLPSISEDGQYVSFTTVAPLARHDDGNEQPDVYVRNMEVEESGAEAGACNDAEAADSAEVLQLCPFTLVSAADGTDSGLTYVEEPGHGAVAAGRSAISASGLQVAFVTTAVSSLAGPSTPAMQVAVRNLASRETELVSSRFDQATGEDVPGEPVSGESGGRKYGAAYDVGEVPRFPFPTGSHTLTHPFGASISADGTTVAWLGADVSEQAEVLPGERYEPEYAEPLWRRIADGPRAPTRRVTGGSDAESPACAASGEQALPGNATLLDPCQGPFRTDPSSGDEGVWGGGESVSDFVPQLSADGYTVAFLASAPLLSLGVDFGLGPKPRNSDVYLADMHPGLSRTQALRPLTELASGDEADVGTNAAVTDLAISPDGTQVAFTTKRTQFTLGVPAFVSAPAAIPGLSEVFDADLADETLTRVTRGFEGGAAAHPHGEARSNEDPYPVEQDGAFSPSFSAGNTLAFSSTASNLVYGDGNTPAKEEGGPFDGADIFVVHRELFTPVPTPQYISNPPANPATAARWALGVTALSLRNGSVRLYVQVPGPGTLRVLAKGAVAVRASHSAASARRDRRSRAGATRSGPARAKVANRTVATAGTLAKGSEGELVTLTLALRPSFRSLAFAHGGLSATAMLIFVAAGHPQLSQAVPVSFTGVRPRARKARAGNAGGRGRAGAGARSERR
ncbi:MAG TPA: hypothetical protein VK790_13235 [Solirubrobacteraceae bacterium]|jgi:hypothetical protein|nr:hypothetical protein [Solirubrobacteraceae bacterium]